MKKRYKWLIFFISLFLLQAYENSSNTIYATEKNGQLYIDENLRMECNVALPLHIGDKISANGEPESVRYTKAYEAFWWQCVRIKSFDLNLRCASSCSGSGGAAQGCSSGAFDALRQITSLLKKYDKNSVQQYLKRIAASQECKEKIKPYFNNTPLITEKYYSPDGNNTISYFLGNNTFYHGDVADSTKILKYANVIVNWLSNNIIEFKHESESNGFYCNYYDYGTKKISKQFGSVKGVDYKRNIVVCAKDFDLEFYDIFSGEKLYVYRIKALEDNKAPGRIHVIESRFNAQGDYMLRYFIDIGTETIKINIQ